MQTVLLVIHLMVVAALVGVVLLQRSEGGALGIGGGGGFMTSRGTANVLTRTTAILAGIFFLTSLGLSILPRFTGSHESILDKVQTTPATTTEQPATPGQGGVLDELNKMSKPASQPANTPVAPAVDIPQAPAAQTPAAPATETPAAPTTDSAPATPAAPANTAPAAPAP